LNQHPKKIEIRRREGKKKMFKRDSGESQNDSYSSGSGSSSFERKDFTQPYYENSNRGSRGDHYQQSTKSEICRDFQRGTCRRGFRCPYIHSKKTNSTTPPSLHHSTPSTSDQSKSNKNNPELCRDYLYRNNCNRGSKCPYLHVSLDVDSKAGKKRKRDSKNEEPIELNMSRSENDNNNNNNNNSATTNNTTDLNNEIKKWRKENTLLREENIYLRRENTQLRSENIRLRKYGPGGGEPEMALPEEEREEGEYTDSHMLSVSFPNTTLTTQRDNSNDIMDDAAEEISEYEN